MSIVTIQAAQALLQDPQRSIGVIDVRHPDEHAAGHLHGARLIDVMEDDFAAGIAALDPAAEYLVYCAKGGRSAKAVELMTAAGFGALHDLEGGFTAWTDAQMPVDKAATSATPTPATPTPATPTPATPTPATPTPATPTD